MRYPKIAFMLLGVYVLTPAFFWNVFWIVVAAEMAHLIFYISLKISLVQHGYKNYISLPVLMLGVSLIEIVWLVALSASMFPSEPWYGAGRVFFYGLVLLATVTARGERN